MFTIFVKDKPLFLTKEENQVKLEDGSFFLRHDSNQTLKHMVDAFEKNEVIRKLYILDSDLNQLWNAFISTHKLIEAAGGVVKNAKGEILFIFRNGKWDLPKGKIEKGEGKEEAALREVKEECGLKKVKIIKELYPTYHTYHVGGEGFLKKSNWFEMYSEEVNLKPQESEGITEVKWIPKRELSEVIRNTYKSIQEVITGQSLS